MDKLIEKLKNDILIELKSILEKQDNKELIIDLDRKFYNDFYYNKLRLEEEKVILYITVGYETDSCELDKYNMQTILDIIDRLKYLNKL